MLEDIATTPRKGLARAQYSAGLWRRTECCWWCRWSVHSYLAHSLCWPTQLIRDQTWLPSWSLRSHCHCRAEVTAALLNAVLLIAAAGWIIVEAVRRISDPPEVSGWGVFMVAVVGLCVNGGSAWLLQRSGNRSMNISGAALHLLGDAAGSFGVLVAGFTVVLWDAIWVDPMVSFLIAGLIMWSGVGLVGRTTRILFEGTPAGIGIGDLTAALTSHESVDDVHHLHVWAVDSTMVALSAHVVVAADSLHDAQLVSVELEGRLQEWGVAHSTLALECHPCGQDSS
ncbi:MAG: cation transporter [Dehalococcoidia bacterium]|nr:cation transporter [Dehalococcoidia bacterium]HCV36610.1 cation transporter [Acidimicrobiaceae bacterium]